MRQNKVHWLKKQQWVIKSQIEAKQNIEIIINQNGSFQTKMRQNKWDLP